MITLNTFRSVSLEKEVTNPQSEIFMQSIFLIVIFNKKV